MITQLKHFAVMVIGIGLLLGIYVEGRCLYAHLLEHQPRPMIVGRNEDYVTASHPTFVATPRGVKRWGTADESKRSKSISWTVKYGNVAAYANNRFPNDGMNEAGLTARTLYYQDGDANETVAPDSKKKELDEDHWVSFVLDNFATVSDAVDAIRNKVHVVSVVGKKGSGFSYATPKHLAMADATGDSAIVEISERQGEHLPRPGVPDPDQSALPTRRNLRTPPNTRT